MRRTDEDRLSVKILLSQCLSERAGNDPKIRIFVFFEKVCPSILIGIILN